MGDLSFPPLGVFKGRGGGHTHMSTFFRLQCLPDEILQIIMGHLDMVALGRVECWSKDWRAWIVPIYYSRYKAEVEKERIRLEDAWNRADEIWAECAHWVVTNIFVPQFPRPGMRHVTYDPPS